MRLAIGRRNENDPDSSSDTLRVYINDAIQLTMTDDVHIFENYSTFTFFIDPSHEDGVWTFAETGFVDNFSTLTIEAMISLNQSLTQPPENAQPLQTRSVVWNPLLVYYDPGIFFNYWGINNYNILIHGMPTELLIYQNEFTFRTIPNNQYMVQIWGYKINPMFSSDGDPEIPQDYWQNYLAYLAALNYVVDYRYDDSQITRIRGRYARERKFLLTRTHNWIKNSRSQPRF